MVGYECVAHTISITVAVSDNEQYSQQLSDVEVLLFFLLTCSARLILHIPGRRFRNLESMY